MRSEIEEKLKLFLEENNHLMTEECQVVYLMVEIRKLLDQTNKNIYPLVRFYGDWAVHNKKTKITKEMKKIAEEINKSIPTNTELFSDGKLGLYAGKVMKFFYMKELRKEMQKSLAFLGLPIEITHHGKNWNSFSTLLIEVLSNQPIIAPIKEIKYISFKLLISKVAASVIVHFNDQRNTCEFKNVF